MISAIKNSSLTGLQVKTLEIREKELTYYADIFKAMASQSALLAGKLSMQSLNFPGFCFSALSMEIEDKVSTSVALGYLSTTVAGMAFGLLCILIATLVSFSATS